jgi:HEPN domain-containing protein
MRNQRLPPDDPREWINRAHSNLAQAEAGANLPAVYLEDLCFQAQQAVEKALKAVLLTRKVRFSRTHDLAELISLIEASGQPLPERVYGAAQLTVFAVGARYPGPTEPVTEDEYDAALSLAGYVVQWAEQVVLA